MREIGFRKRTAAVWTVVAVCAGLEGCAGLPPEFDPTGPLFDLPPEMASDIRIDTVRVTYAPRQSHISDKDVGENDILPYNGDSDGTSTRRVVEGEVEQETRLCATGARGLYMNIALDEFRFDERLQSLRDGHGAHIASGWVTLVDPSIRDGNPVVGRYHIRSGSRSGQVLERIVTDWRAANAEEFGRAVCMNIFGRNPRPHPLQNSTPG